ncbi:hypothetical protein HU675_0037980 [Bradyrhizobium septentrionale]|uniref:hypothetical protein n=1 Tax=Bradyrhizobium septentrionale TaxID=1404411 RepID=UPI001596D882|nr:hypothetical protein [Bradyrhizobium septentrionale]UGY23680.1 hypothetical protein HU675_0037980 [Bradyrhizobium septentrionale]
MRKLVTIKFGSHLFGTTTPSSDLDYKSVFVPAAGAGPFPTTVACFEKRSGLISRLKFEYSFLVCSSPSYS